MQLRQYQVDALAAVYGYWAKGGENPLVELATGTGKSLLQAELGRGLIENYPDMRIISITHVKELIEQNWLELLEVWPSAPAGVYSAGLGRREANAQFLFAGIQTVHSKAARIGHVDLVMVDEAHLIPRSADTMYGKFLGGLATINPDLRVCGFTATPYRTDSGRLDEGDVRLFDEIVFTYGVADGIRDGFLAPLVSKGMATGFDLGSVGRRGGDYVPSALQQACDQDGITRSAVDEITRYGHNRKSWLVFCAGVQHAEHAAAEIRSRGISCACITTDTPAMVRRQAIAAHKSGELRCLTNNSVLTTGYNNPGVDLLAMLRPTLSAGLYVQMAGRGTRNADGKADCLVLDFAGNVRRHGPVDAVEPKKPGEGKGEAPIKECPECHSLVHLSAKECQDCGYKFPVNEKPKHDGTAAALPILSNGNVPLWETVSNRAFRYHEKPGGTDSVRAEYNWGDYKTWICPGHEGYPKRKADSFWRDHGGIMPPPSDVDEFLERQGELRPSKQIQVKRNGKYWEVVGIKAMQKEAA